MKIALVLTETRHYDIKKIVEKHTMFLPEMDIVCFHYDNIVNIPCIKYKLPQNIVNLYQYNLLMTSEWYWNRLNHYDKVLIIQNDSEILREGLNEFLGYDYIGAPWKFQEQGGNGGFSLRNVKQSKWIIEHELYSPMKGYEDVFFVNEMIKHKMNIATREVCEQFSCETIFKLGTFGIHAVENYLSKEQCNQIRHQYETQAI